MNLDGLYELLEYNDCYACLKLSDAEHPIFKAHFVGNPLLPAFIYFELVSEIFKINIQKIKKAKFNEIVKPEATLVFKRENTSFTVHVEDKKVASFLIE